LDLYKYVESNADIAFYAKAQGLTASWLLY